MRRNRVTLQDIADRSGYSLRTVKKVLADEKVREKTRKEVMLVVEELQYMQQKKKKVLMKNQKCRLAAVYTPISRDSYYPEIHRSLNEFAHDRRDYGVSVEFHIAEREHWVEQKRILEELVRRDDIQGVLLQPIHISMLNEQIDALVESGKAVFTFGADAPTSSRISYIGPDARKAGRIGAQVLANYIGRKGKAAIISQAHGHMQTDGRKHGFMELIQRDFPEINVYELSIPDDSDLYYDMVRSIVVGGDINALFCTDANTYIAGSVLRKLGRRDIVVVGFDLNEDAIELMQQGYITAIIDQNPGQMAYRAMEMLFKYLYMGRKPERIHLTPLSLLTSECLGEEHTQRRNCKCGGSMP